MSDKKKHKHEEKVNENKIEAVATPENPDQSQPGIEAKAVATIEGGDQLSVEVEALKIQLADAESKLAESVEGWQRSVADFQNYKKRIERDRESERALMKGDLIKKVLPVLDDLERALREAGRPANNAWADGIELIARKLQNLLEAEGVKRIEAMGVPFDPNFHEAISHEPADDVESGHVIDIIQNGYTLGDRVIRPALVRVAQ